MEGTDSSSNRDGTVKARTSSRVVGVVEEENSKHEGTEMKRASKNDCLTINCSSILEICIDMDDRVQAEELFQQKRTIGVRT
jgi:hypothetical protein